MKIEECGYTGKDNCKAGEIIARVITTNKDRFEVISSHGQCFATIKQGAYYNREKDYTTIGDFVKIEWNDAGDSRILEVLKRKTCFSRLDPIPNGTREQIIAANFDFVFIIESLNDNFSLHRLERYLTLA